MAFEKPNNLNQKLLSVMECPVCYEMLRPPIRLCENGHGICSNCFSRLSPKCPICRGGMLQNRCNLLENLFGCLTITCRNQSRGCRFVGEGMEVASHEENCEFQVRPCPRSTQGCCWEGPLSFLTKHYVENHSTSGRSHGGCTQGQNCMWRGCCGQRND